MAPRILQELAASIAGIAGVAAIATAAIVVSCYEAAVIAAATAAEEQ